MSVQIQTHRSAEHIARYAGDSIADLVRNDPECVLGLSSGSTPLQTYRHLVGLHNEGLSFRDVTMFNLDEYVGLSSDHPQSYHRTMSEHLFDHLDVEQVHIPDGQAEDLDMECLRFEQAIADVDGVDLWLLGIGSNGHIAFNEPGCSADSRTRVVDLAPSTITANSRFFDSQEDVPRQALTVGIATILEARKILLLATGGSKAEAICEALAGAMSPDCPASYLQDHPDCTFLLDDEAASLLNP